MVIAILSESEFESHFSSDLLPLEVDAPALPAPADPPAEIDADFSPIPRRAPGSLSGSNRLDGGGAGTSRDLTHVKYKVPARMTMMDDPRVAVMMSLKSHTPRSVWRTERAAEENICVTGLVTLILINAATQMKNPNNPVTALPAKNTFQSSLPSVMPSMSLESSVISPLKMTKGASITADPALVQYANWIEELFTCGRDDLMRTAWSAIMSEERKPKMSARAATRGDSWAELRRDWEGVEGATPTRKPEVTMMAARRMREDGRTRVFTAETMIVRGRTMPRAI